MFDNKEKDEILDSDSDGLSDYEESNIYFTDPFDPDTDGDGINDGDEASAGSNPNGSGKLIDFFVPHKGNDYKPNSLHPKRLIFHALAAVLIKFLIFIFAVSFPIEAWLTPDVIMEQSRKIISLTNVIRKDAGLNALKENTKLTQAALAKAGDMLLNQYFEHISPTKIGLASWLKKFNYNYLAGGENLAMGFNDAAEVVNAWTKSMTHYANIIDPDYTEIGVGMVTGPFQKEETTLVAQFFGLPPQNIVKEKKNTVVSQTVVKEPAPKAVLTPTSQGTVAGKTITVASSMPKPVLTPTSAPTSTPILISTSTPTSTPAFVATTSPVIAKADTADNTPPQVDQTKTKVMVDLSASDDSIIVSAEAYLSVDTRKSEVFIHDTRIELTRDETDLNKWTGRQIVFLNAKIDKKSPLILPSLIAEDYYGNTVKTDISWENARPNGISLFDKYAFFKNNRSVVMESLFNISSFYYKMLLIFLSISLLFSIFIEVRKQHPHIIFSTLGVMGLLIMLIVF